MTSKEKQEDATPEIAGTHGDMASRSTNSPLTPEALGVGDAVAQRRAVERAVGRFACHVAVRAGDLGRGVFLFFFGGHRRFLGSQAQIRMGMTTYLKPAWSGTVMSALELVSCNSTVTISWPMLESASIR